MTLLAITSCSSKLLYNNLDWIAAWYIDDFVTLTDAQEDKFDPEIEQFLAWHRTSELEQYITQIKQIKSDINKGIKEDNIKNYISALKGFWQNALMRIEPTIVKLAYTLKDEQVKELLDEIEQRNLDRLEEYSEETQEQRLVDRLERIEDRVESFVGDLNEQQKQLLKMANDSSTSAFHEWIKYRRAWADAIRIAYTLRENKLAFEKAISHLILHADTFRSEVYWQKIQYNQKIWVATFSTLLASLNKKQLEKLNEKLDDYIEDFEELI